MQMVDGYTNGRVTESKKYSCPLRHLKGNELQRNELPFIRLKFIDALNFFGVWN